MHCRDDRQRAAQTVPGKKQRLFSAATPDRVFNPGPDCPGGIGEPPMKPFRRYRGLEVGDHILRLERIGAGKCDESRAVPPGDDEAGFAPKKSLNHLVGTEVQ